MYIQPIYQLIKKYQVIGRTFRIYIVYSWLNYMADEIRWLFSATTITLSFMKLMYVSF